MKHSLITSIIGLAMVASVSTMAVAEDNFSILKGIQAEALTTEEMEETQGRGCIPIGWTGGCSGLFSGMLQNYSYGGGYSQVFTPGGAMTNANLFQNARNSGDAYTTNYANSTANNCNYWGTCGPAVPANLTGTVAGTLIQAAGLDPSTGQNSGITQGYSVPQVQAYNPYAQVLYQQQMRQYQLQQAYAQAQATYRYNQGLQNTFSGLSLAGIKIGCGLAYCR